MVVHLLRKFEEKRRKVDAAIVTDESGPNRGCGGSAADRNGCNGVHFCPTPVSSASTQTKQTTFLLLLLPFSLLPTPGSVAIPQHAFRTRKGCEHPVVDVLQRGKNLNGTQACPRKFFKKTKISEKPAASVCPGT